MITEIFFNRIWGRCPQTHRIYRFTAYGIQWYINDTVMEDKATLESDLSATAVPNGTGGIFVIPPAYNMPVAPMR